MNFIYVLENYFVKLKDNDLLDLNVKSGSA